VANVAFINPYVEQEQGIARRKALSAALQQQSIAPPSSPNVAPGGIAYLNPFEPLGKLGQAYFGKKGFQSAEADQSALNQKRMADVKAWMDRNYGSNPQVAAALEGMQLGAPGADKVLESTLTPQKQDVESFGTTPVKQADGSVVLVGNRGTVKPTDLKLPEKPEDKAKYEYRNMPNGGVGVFLDGQLVRTEGQPADLSQQALSLAKTPVEQAYAKADPAGFIKFKGEQEGKERVAEKGATKVSQTNITEGERKETKLGIRIVPANAKINSMLEQGYRPSQRDYWTAGPAATNWLASNEGQMYMNAGREFVAGVLRGDSGATITDDEWKMGLQQWIPVPGEGDDIIAQKKANRDAAIAGSRVAAGRGAPNIPASSPAPNIPAPSGPRPRATNAKGEAVEWDGKAWVKVK
jgi:hypothetical protein